MKLQPRIILAFLLPLALGLTCVRGGKKKTEPLITPVTEFYADSMRVLVWPTAHDIVSAQIVFEGGVTNYPAELQGIEYAVLRTVVPPSTPRASYRIILTRDYSAVSLTTRREFFSAAFSELCRSLNQEHFDKERFYTARDLCMAEAARAGGSLTSQAQVNAARDFFAQRQYAKTPYGTPETLEDVHLSEAESFYKGILLNRRKTAVLFSGGTDYERAGEAVMNGLSFLEAKPYTPIRDAVFQPTKTRVEMHKREGVYSCAVATFTAPAAGSQEAAELEVALEVLRRRMDQLLRSSDGEYACGFSCCLNEGIFPTASLQLFNSKGAACLSEFMEELRDVRSSITPEEVQEAAAVLRTQHYLQREGAENRCNMLAAALAAGDWTRAFAAPPELEKAQADQVSGTFRKYTPALIWSVTGDTSYAIRKQCLQSLE